MAPVLEALFTPGTIGSLPIKNRVVMPPMGTNYATWTGAVTPRLIDYLVERARGGVGLITVEFSYVHPTGKVSYCCLGIHDDALIPGLRRLTDAVHAAGAKVSIQIAHGGRRSKSVITGTQPVAPSPIPCVGGEVPREMSGDEIERMVSWFAHAARRVREAGFDAVTLHVCAGYLLQTFLSPYANRRTDAYGGSLEGRLRLPLEVVAAVRHEVGREFPIICRLSVDEFVEGGLTLADARRMAAFLERAGVDAIDTAAGIPETMYAVGPPMALPRGFLASHARAIKEAVRIPVFAVGRINDPRLAERILRDGSADFISMGRALLADPELPNKARDGRFDEIRPCIACNEGCFQRLYSQLDVSCVVNPRVGRETLFPAEHAAKSRKVLIVGGGPAGMMAALTANARGHRVILCEREARLGGQLSMGDVPPHKEEIGTLRDYLTDRVAKSAIETRLETTITDAVIDTLAPDVVVVATGAQPLRPRFPVAGKGIVTAWDILSRRETAGSKVVIVGGGEVGCELAELLASEGKEVVIVEVLPDIATSMELRGRVLLAQRLRDLGVTVLTQSQVDAVNGTTVIYEQGGLKHRIDGVATVVSAIGSASQQSLRPTRETHFIGDCVKPRRILEAMREGFELAYAI